MFKKYIATKKDFKAIEEGISLAYSKKINFFPRGGLEKADVLMFDSRHVYIWSKRKYSLQKIKTSVENLTLYKWKHKKIIPDNVYRGCGVMPDELINIFKVLKHDQFFFCAPVTCFIKSQKKIKRAGINPFTTKESYIYTIIHEFGHHYYHLHSKQKSSSIKLIKKSANAWKNKKTKFDKLPIPRCHISELFAALCDITVSKLLKSKYYQKIKSLSLSELRCWNNEPESYFDQIHRYAYTLAPLYALSHPSWFEDLLCQY